jgi:hypothetical protein
METKRQNREHLAAIALLSLLALIHVQATVAAAEFTLAVEALGAGQVAVNPDLASYPSGTAVMLTAIPDDDGSALVGWAGDASGQEDDISVVMDADKSITAEFGMVITVGPHRYAFGEARKSLANPAFEENGFITSDGLSMYYVAFRYDLLPETVSSIFRVTRPDVDAPWGEPADLMGDHVNTGLHYNWNRDPSLADDELTLYYHSIQTTDPFGWPTANRWLAAHRTSKEAEFDFSEPEEVLRGSDDVEPGSITRDGTGWRTILARPPWWRQTPPLGIPIRRCRPTSWP